jgi:hypothetical protein
VISISSSQILSFDERAEYKSSVNKRAHPWSAHEKKAYTRLMSGMIKNYLLNKRLIMLTLTTSSLTGEGLTPNERKELVQMSWKKLKMLIDKYYRIDSYFKVVTTEGYGVIHILYVGDEIPVDWLMYQWQRIHGSVIVHIEYIYGTPYDASHYVINQYVSGHGTSFTYGSSQNWCYRGYLKDMDEIRNENKDYSSNLYTYGNVWHILNTEKFISAWYRHLANKFVVQRDFDLNLVGNISYLYCLDCGQSCGRNRLTCPGCNSGRLRSC